MTAPAGTAPAGEAPVDGAGLGGLARRGLLSLAGSAVSAVAGVLVVLAVTRLVDRETAGVYFALTSVFLIVGSIAQLGTGTGVVWALSRTRALGEPGRAAAFLRVALTPVVLGALLLAAGLALAAEPLGRWIAPEPATGSTVLAIRVLACLLPLAVLSDVLVACTRGYGVILPTVALDRVGRPVFQLAAVVLAAGAGSVAAVSVAWAAPWVVSAALATAWLLRIHRRSLAAGATTAPAAPLPWRDFWTFTAPRSVTAVTQLVLQRLDIVLVTVLAGPAEAAIYTAATRFLVVGQFVNQALASVTEPRLSRLLTLRDHASARTVYQAVTGWQVALSWPFYLFVAAVADGFLDLFGDGYDAGTPAVLLLAGTMLVASAIGMVDVPLVMSGRTSWNLGNALAALAVNVTVNLLLIPPLGLTGAAIAWAAAILVKNLLPLAQVWRSLDMHPFGRGTLLAAGLSLACVGAPLALVRALGGDPALTAVVGVLAGAVFCVCCWRSRSTLALDVLRGGRRRPV